MSTTLAPIVESAILAGDAPAFRNAIRHGGPLPDFAMSSPVSVAPSTDAERTADSKFFFGD
jgi:hypothetical protein